MGECRGGVLVARRSAREAEFHGAKIKNKDGCCTSAFAPDFCDTPSRGLRAFARRGRGGAKTIVFAPTQSTRTSLCGFTNSLDRSAGRDRVPRADGWQNGGASTRQGQGRQSGLRRQRAPGARNRKNGEQRLLRVARRHSDAIGAGDVLNGQDTAQGGIPRTR